MAITPADIQAQTFPEAKRGYDPAAVDVFLEQLANEVDAMLSKIVDLKGRLTTTEQQLSEARSQVTQSSQSPVSVPVEQSATERQISAALIAAQRSADMIVGEAQENAERIRAEADTKAREVIRQALTEKQNELEEIDRLKTSREEFRGEYIKLVQHFMDEAQNTFPADLLTVSPVGSGSSHVSQMPAALESSTSAAPTAADPFAPLDNFGADDLD
ncbi:DivIVA domain protein [Coriobacterium glomerans PW2]|uniref:Cell wall synthesis protein Wag31 n=1 Tax=Coriobacterium glomerans (strain ATCC 49209 / DSM 20642 / JCM 10262 / PW2) TaxID=700015 RepID=F2NBT1_CORGP|nr:DivIVA domain-containing protein [Coriobacterium glomerans]AEB06890.1 DivIVA domain protein [Coriobacterium glomerans PW2]